MELLRVSLPGSDSFQVSVISLISVQFTPKFRPLVPNLRGSCGYLRCTEDLDENVVPSSSCVMNMCIIHNSGISG